MTPDCVRVCTTVLRADFAASNAPLDLLLRQVHHRGHYYIVPVGTEGASWLNVVRFRPLVSL